MRRFLIDDPVFPLSGEPATNFVVTDGEINDFTGFAYMRGYLSVRDGAFFITDYNVNMYLKDSFKIKFTSDLNDDSIIDAKGFTTNISQVIYGDKQKVERIASNIKEIIARLVIKT